MISKGHPTQKDLLVATCFDPVELKGPHFRPVSAVRAWRGNNMALASYTSAAIVCRLSLNGFLHILHSLYLSGFECLPDRLVFLPFLDVVLPQCSQQDRQQDRLGDTEPGSGYIWLISCTQESSLLCLSVIPMPATCQNPVYSKYGDIP